MSVLSNEFALFRIGVFAMLQAQLIRYAEFRHYSRIMF
jgi:hypothetical protein